MAIYDISQATIKESDCDSKISLLDKNTCYDDLIGQYNEVIKTNTDALNADATNSGSYAILAKFKQQLAACSASDTNCITSASVNISNTNNEISTREGRIAAAKKAIQILTLKKSSIQGNPVYKAEVSSKKQKTVITWIVIIVVVIALIVLGIRLYKKYKN